MNSVYYSSVVIETIEITQYYNIITQIIQNTALNHNNTLQTYQKQQEINTIKYYIMFCVWFVYIAVFCCSVVIGTIVMIKYYNIITQII